jgi:hypothetical protein
MPTNQSHHLHNQNDAPKEPQRLFDQPNYPKYLTSLKCNNNSSNSNRRLVDDPYGITPPTTNSACVTVDSAETE